MLVDFATLLLLIFIAVIIWEIRKTINGIDLMVEDLWLKKATLGEQEKLEERIKERNQLY